MKAFRSIFMILSAMTAGVCMFLFQNVARAQESGIMTDKRNGNTYHWMKFGKKAWMTDNMNIATSSGSWVYNDDTANARNYGRLYDYTSALTVCPKGWHLPTDEEWAALIEVLGGENKAGEKFFAMDTVGHGSGYKTDTPTILGGVRHSDGSYTGIGLWGGMWSATAADENSANNILFARSAKALSRVSQTKGSAFTVRCIKNK